LKPLWAKGKQATTKISFGMFDVKAVVFVVNFFDGENRKP
jgi:hypothetical protein